LLGCETEREFESQNSAFRTQETGVRVQERRVGTEEKLRLWVFAVAGNQKARLTTRGTGQVLGILCVGACSKIQGRVPKVKAETKVCKSLGPTWIRTRDQGIMSPLL
jgi:hypothetical protein